MNIYIYRKNKLSKLFSKQVYIDNFTLEKKMQIADSLVEKYSRHYQLNNIKAKELLIAVKLYLFRYYLRYVSGLYIILEKNDLHKKNIILIRGGIKKLYRFRDSFEIVFPCKYSMLSIPLRLILSLIKGIFISKTQNTLEDILVLAPIKELQIIWENISKYIKLSYKVEKGSICSAIPFKNFIRKDNLLKNIKKGLKQLKEKIPFSLISIIFFNIYAVYHFFYKHPARITISFEEATPESALIAYVSKKMKKISVDIAHAATFGPNYKHVPFNYCFVYGKSSRESFQRENSILCGKIIEAGAPKLDRFFHKERQNNTWRNRILFLPNYIVVGREKEQRIIMENIQKLVTSFPEIKMTIKTHPARDNPLVEKYFSHLSNVTIKKEADLLEEIDSHDLVVIVGWSSSGLEVMIRNKFLIRLNTERLSDWFGFTEKGYGMDAITYEELEHAYLEIIEKKMIPDASSREKLLKYHLSNHGRASEYVANILNEL